MKFYHVSMDLKLEETKFIPRVPKYRCKNEDDKIKRICVCKSIEDAISAFPYKDYLVNNALRRKNDNYLTVCEIETEDYVDSEQLNNKVPDFHLTNECWILSSFTAMPYMIKIKKLKLEGYNAYIDKYRGRVSVLDYEPDTVDYDRQEEFVLLSREIFNKFSKIVSKNNMQLEVLEDKHIKLTHIYKNVTTKVYHWIKVRIFIPSGVSVASLWKENDKQNNFAIRKKLRLDN